MFATHLETSRAYCRVGMHWPGARWLVNRNSPGFLSGGAEGAGDHCEVSARSVYFQRAYDWLDGVFGR